MRTIQQLLQALCVMSSSQASEHSIRYTPYLNYVSESEKLALIKSCM